MNARTVLITVIQFLLYSYLQFACAQVTAEYKPRLLRSEESYDHLPDSLKRSAWLKMKNISMGDNLRGSFGFNYREMLEWIKSDEQMGVNDVYWLTRMSVHGEINWKQQYRIFAQLSRAIVQGKKFPIRIVDQDQLFFLNVFGEVKFGKRHQLMLRAGRQELLFGAGRLIAPREGPNVRNSFDGVRLQARGVKSTWDLFLTYPVVNKPGVLDDTWFNSASSLWGSYHSIRLLQIPVELYYLGYFNRRAPFGSNGQPGRETRHTFGSRVLVSNGRMSYDVEGAWQAGSFENTPIRAWMLDGKVGLTTRIQRSILKSYVRMGYFSGTRTATSKTLGSFNPLFPNLLYYQTAVGLFPSNLINPQASAELVYKKLKCLFSYDFFWRASIYDDLLAPFGRIPLPDKNGKYLGSQAALKSDYEFSPNVEATLLVSRYYKSSLIKENSDPRGVDILVNLVLNLKF